MIVEDQLDRGAGRIGGIEKLEEFDDLRSKNTAEQAAIPIAVAEHRRYPCVQCVQTLLMLSKLKRWAMNDSCTAAKSGRFRIPYSAVQPYLRAYHCGGISAASSHA